MSKQVKAIYKKIISTWVLIAHCQFLGFLIIFIFCHFCWRFSTLHTCSRFFFVKSKCSVLKNFLHFIFILTLLFLKILIDSYGTRVCGSVFKMKFRGLSWEFESIWMLQQSLEKQIWILMWYSHSHATYTDLMSWVWVYLNEKASWFTLWYDNAGRVQKTFNVCMKDCR